jgi:ABC-type dipeptide/oligopeptide/nickel transport system ATPase subunit
VLVAQSISKTYHGRSRRIHALIDVSIKIAESSTVAVVGPSGSGKSTLARCLAGLETPDQGIITLDGRRVLRRAVQLVFQDAAMAFNPSMKVEEIVSEPLRIAGSPRKEQYDRSVALLDQVQLPAASMYRLARELSGGQRQRLAIARALAADPRVLILDEALSGLDLIVQNQLIELLRSLQSLRLISYMVISHDLLLAAQLADQIAVMDAGRIVEEGTTQDLVRNARTPCAQALLHAASELHIRHNPRAWEDA